MTTNNSEDDQLENTGTKINSNVSNNAVDINSLFNSIFGSRHASERLPAPCANGNTAEYQMNYKKRGMCIIINNRTFDKHLGMDERRGTDVDACKLLLRFRDLNFSPVRYDNLSVGEIVHVLKGAANDDHTDSDCFACCIMSHGDRGIIYGRDGILSLDLVFSLFKENGCPTLTGKPKLFFIQACQGTEFDKGLKVRSKLITDSRRTDIVLTNPDFMVGFSTVPGFYSWRSRDTGSWFMEALCSVLKKCGDSVDLQNVMCLVNRYVAYEFQSYVPSDHEMNKKKQMPFILSTLTKLLYFHPKARNFPIQV